MLYPIAYTPCLHVPCCAIETWGKMYGVAALFLILDMGYEIKTQHRKYPMSAIFLFISAQV
jgi:hypothetical protein